MTGIGHYSHGKHTSMMFVLHKNNVTCAENIQVFCVEIEKESLNRFNHPDGISNRTHFREVIFPWDIGTVNMSEGLG